MPKLESKNPYCLPWHAVGHNIYDANGHIVCQCRHGVSDNRAQVSTSEFIVESANTIGDLVEKSVQAAAAETAASQTVAVQAAANAKPVAPAAVAPAV